jgi:hypothetical protein
VNQNDEHCWQIFQGAACACIQKVDFHGPVPTDSCGNNHDAPTNNVTIDGRSERGSDNCDRVDSADGNGDTYCASSSDSNSDTDCDEICDADLNEQLAQWSTQYGINQSALGGLLQLLQPLHPALPKDPRTLLATPRQVHLKTLSDEGLYYHFGVANAIRKHILQRFVREDVNQLSLQINIDGVPLFKSSNYQFWPILGILQESVDNEPFIIGVYAGSRKPTNVEEYLHDFVTEMLDLEQNAMFVGTDRFKLCVHSFVCDAPARAFVKCVKSHTGYYGCDRCV